MDTASKFLSTLSLRRATDDGARGFKIDLISIHALLAESDPGKVKVVEPGLAFLSTLSLRRATYKIWHLWAIIIFLSTLSLRRATPQHQVLWPRSNYFYPRSPCGERRYPRAEVYQLESISIHALLAESDPCIPNRRSGALQFLSTLSLRRATKVLPAMTCTMSFLSTLSLRRATVELTTLVNKLFISIHALLAESDY